MELSESSSSSSVVVVSDINSNNQIDQAQLHRGSDIGSQQSTTAERKEEGDGLSGGGDVAVVLPGPDPDVLMSITPWLMRFRGSI